MRTPFLPVMSLAISSVLSLAAQEPVMIAGGSAPPRAVMSSGAAQPAPQPAAYAAVPVVYQQPVVYVPAGPAMVNGAYAPGACAPYPARNVVYFGGPNSCYYANGYSSSYYRPDCAYSPSVIYFGRGEACQRGYAFRHYR
jgi:hypothetical protein